MDNIAYNNGVILGEIAYFGGEMKKILNKEQVCEYRNKLFAEGLFPAVLIEEGSWFRVKTEEKLIFQGDDPEYFFYIYEGVVQLRHLLPNGKILTINTFSAPCIIGEMELVGSGLDTLQVTAKTELLVFAVGMERAKEILLEDTAFLKKLCVILSKKERSAIAKLAIDRGYSSSVRLARFILDNEVDSVYSIKKVDASEALGISYRHLEKLFCDFVEAEYLEKRKNKYFIKNKSALKNISDEVMICQLY